jgi:hypothetical protein
MKTIHTNCKEILENGFDENNEEHIAKTEETK